MNIKVTHAFPPIPTNRFDYSAVDDDTYDAGGPIGFGSTPAEAIADLNEQIE